MLEPLLVGAAGVRLAGAHRRRGAEEMLRVFNCGIGMAVVVADPDAATALLRDQGESVARIGHIEAGSGPPEVRIDLPAGWPGWLRRARTAILISGRGSNMAALIAAARDPAYPAEIVLVVSNRPDARGAGAGAARPACAAAAIDHRPFRGDRAAHEAAIDAALRRAGVEIVCLAGYMRLLTPLLVDAWQGRMLNIHPSLLPAFPGLDTHARALAAGVKLHGCTVHLVTQAMDEGPILAQAAVPVLPGDTAETLAARVLVQEHRIYPMALRWFLADVGGEAAPADAALVNPQAVGTAIG